MKKHDFSFTGGGVNGLINKMFKAKDYSSRFSIRLSVFLVLAVFPIVLFNGIDGTLFGGDDTVALFDDIEIMSRLFIVIPFLIYIEQYFETPFNNYISYTKLLINEEDRSSLNKDLDKFSNVVSSYIPELILLLLLVLATAFWANVSDSQESSWLYQHNQLGALKLSKSGWWFVFVSIPLYQFLFIRWLWRWLLWITSLVIFNRYRWNIHAMHGDKLAGLEYLNFVPFFFGICSVAIGINLSSIMYSEIIEGLKGLMDYKFIIIAFAVCVPLICFSPLLILAPKISKLRSDTIYKFGMLIQNHHKFFEQKWFGKPEEEVKELVGSADPSSMCDINGSYEFVKGMSIVPIDTRLLIVLATILLVPFLPLLSTMYSVKELFQLVVKSMM
ncbi:hypothetical protein EI427_04445 [Flammeovirga pectinis]|uniref:Uncharacterized protein n=1 Tax=Flammeovirga pectinis TaxID=2494373 RepID=A0A3Q9FLQ7_9BACT|nr:hypothetical protein [Flammeovirga pectinis]AZQ61503.1 hypothetical protein EI427_04445 [Flammeovirga pectinis]